VTAHEDDELAALWSASSAPAEERELERMAQRIPRRAQLDQWGEVALLAMLVVGIGLAIMWRGDPATMLVGGLIVLALGGSVWKRHQLGKISLMIDQSDRLTFVRTLLRAKEAQLRRSRLGLVLMPPAFALTILLGFFLREPAGKGDLASFVGSVLLAPRGLVLLVVFVGAVAALTASHLRLAGEVRRIRALKHDYHEENSRDG
jgi:hypothetical protein